MNRVWTVIVVTGLGTFAMRASFIAAARRLTRVPPGVQRLLRQIAPAALSCLVVPAIVRPAGSLDLVQPRCIAGVLAALVALRTGSVALTLAVGLIVVMALNAL